MRKLGELSEIIGVVDRTFRRWCLLFEEGGHAFQFDERGKRGFTDRDIAMFTLFQEKCKTMRSEDAVSFVLTKFKKGELQPKFFQAKADLTFNLPTPNVENLIPAETKSCVLQSECLVECDHKYEQMLASQREFGNILKGDWVKMILFCNALEVAQSVIYDKWEEHRIQVERIYSMEKHHKV
jgi:hypothetical protein